MVTYVLAQSASGLLIADSNGSPDPYVILKFAGQKRQTRVFPKTVSPVWGERHFFDCPTGLAAEQYQLQVKSPRIVMQCAPWAPNAP